MAVTYSRSELTGGSSTALDGIDGANLLDGDRAIVITSSNAYFYYLEATSGAVESPPDVITPDVNAGDKRWILKSSSVNNSITDGNTDTAPSEDVVHDALAGKAGSTHATQHESGGDDVIKLDDLAIPGDNTDLDASASAHGLMPKLAGNRDQIIDGGSNWTDTGATEGNILVWNGTKWTPSAGQPVQMNKNTITSDTTISEGYNAMSVGPLDIDANVIILGNWEVI